MPTGEQAAEIRAKLTAADEAAARGEDPRPLRKEAEALMMKYRCAEEPGLDDEGNP